MRGYGTAFRKLRSELSAHGAPRFLIRAAERAARDEIRHARMARALARRHGGVWRAPIVTDTAPRDVEAIATENAVEGCVRETFGAVLATWQARAAKDASIRATMERIARDETRHAVLAHNVDAWIIKKLDRTARGRVQRARQLAFEGLVTTCGELDCKTRAALGLPTGSETRQLATRMAAARSRPATA